MVDLVYVLTQEFVARRAKNSSYSLRAYARDLQVSKSALSSAMNGKSILSHKNQTRVRNAIFPLPRNGVVELEADNFLIFHRWQYLAIMNLCFLRHHKASSLWVSKKLGIKVSEAKSAIETLVKARFLKIVGGKFVRVSPRYVTKNDEFSEVLRNYHRQAMQLASGALDYIPLKEREFQTTCIAVPKSKLQGAKEKIRKFHGELVQYMEQAPGEELYYLSTFFFPIVGCER